jgi:hypothetical protein
MKRILVIGAAAACTLLASGATADTVWLEGLVVSADGGFTPHKLPRRAYAPIEFRGHIDVRSNDGSVPPALRQVVVDFDHDGRLATRGLPTCDPALLQEATPEEARARCRGAIVGSGHIEALISRENQPPAPARSLLTLFNGPRQEGHPTVILHARTTEPVVQNFAIAIPVKRRAGDFRYRVTIDLPPIVAGRGALTHIDVKVGRRYRFGGKRRSYLSARCGDGILLTHGRLTFSDEPSDTIIDSSVEKACTPR